MQKFEYKLLGHSYYMDKQAYYWDDNEDDMRGIEDRINELGKEGWELVAIRQSGQLSAGYYFKRPIE